MLRPDFCQLALPHMDALYRTACRLSRGPAEAEDLVQETYLEGFRSYPSLREPQRCRAWLFRILHNIWSERLSRDTARRAAWDLAAPDQPLAPDGATGAGTRGDLEQEIARRGYSDEIERALETLPEEFRTAVLLVTVEELTYAEVAEVMSCPIGTVRSRVARGRALLAAALSHAALSEPRKESL